jgi:hypothetical protein
MLGDFVGFVTNQFSDLKVAEGESPRPLDRVFFRFNFYNNVDKSTWQDPSQPIHNVNLYRYVFGVEKSFLDEHFSLGLRVPFDTIDAEGKDFVLTTSGTRAVAGDDGFATTHFGNINMIAKAALWEDRAQGNLISAGFSVSFPTASSTKINPGASVVTYVQPFVGFIWNRGNFFFQGFTSVALPVDGAESILLFTDLGVGYCIYRDTRPGAMLVAMSPTVEIHLTDPLRNADATVDSFGIFDTLKVHNVVDVTLGTTFEFLRGTTLGVGIVVPCTGPKPFDIEALAQLNYRF